jgi:hypothetical protein
MCRAERCVSFEYDLAESMDIPDNYEQPVIVSGDYVFDLSSAFENGGGTFQGERQSIARRSGIESVEKTWAEALH